MTGAKGFILRGYNGLLTGNDIDAYDGDAIMAATNADLLISQDVDVTDGVITVRD